MTIANRLPDLARQTSAAFDAQGQGHSILGRIVMLIDQRCVLTLRRLSPPTGDSAGTDDAADGTIDDDGADGATHGPG